jgi:fused signal recognition particle receptor
MTQQIIDAVRKAYETQGRSGLAIFEIAQQEIENALAADSPSPLNGERAGVRGEAVREGQKLYRSSSGPTVVSIVGVNGTGKTTTAAKLAKFLQTQNHPAVLAACDTFRAAAIEQIKLWGERLDIPVIAGEYGADPAAVAHDAVAAAQSRGAHYLLVDTAGRLHTKHNLMQELQKVHRVMDKKLPGAPHETLLVLDATTGMNALNQAREFHKAVKLTGLIVTKLDGTSKGGVVVAIQKELGLPIKFIGLGEKPDDLQPFDAKQFAEALFTVKE